MTYTNKQNNIRKYAIMGRWMGRGRYRTRASGRPALNLYLIKWFFSSNNDISKTILWRAYILMAPVSLLSHAVAVSAPGPESIKIYYKFFSSRWPINISWKNICLPVERWRYDGSFYLFSDEPAPIWNRERAKRQMKKQKKRPSVSVVMWAAQRSTDRDR